MNSNNLKLLLFTYVPGISNTLFNQVDLYASLASLTGQNLNNCHKGYYVSLKS